MTGLPRGGRTVFLGSGPLGRAMLRALCGAGHRPALVVSQPPRRRRRRGAPEPTPVHAWADAEDIAVHVPADVNTDESLARLRETGADLFVVAEYGQILRQPLLDIPPLGTINVHTSLLPRWRGATPIEAAIMAGDAVTGVTIQRTVLALDAGPVLHRLETELDPRETKLSLTARLEELGAAALTTVMARFAAGENPQGEPQDPALVTTCRRLRPEDGRVDWSSPAAHIDRMIRAYHPGPGAHAVLVRDPELAVDLLEATVVGAPVVGATAGAATAQGADPGTVVGVAGDSFDVAAGEGVLRVTRLLPASRKPLPAQAFLNGYRLRVGERFR